MLVQKVGSQDDVVATVVAAIGLVYLTSEWEYFMFEFPKFD